MTRYAMAIDTNACIGCYACTVACKVENASPADVWLAPVLEREVGTFPDTSRLYLPTLCHHCDDAPCMQACPTRAISRRDDGIVVVAQDVCCGSRACVLACPYGALHYVEGGGEPQNPFERLGASRHQAGTVHKCTFCADRVDQGLAPACVETCPTDARIFGDLDDPDSPVSVVLHTHPSTPMAAPVDTGPNVRYLTEGIERSGASPTDVTLQAAPQRQWGPAHALEFTLLGAGAGVLLAALLLGARLPWLRLDALPLLAVGLVGLGGLVLIGDLGRPARFARAFAGWRSSWISRGAVANVVFGLSAAALALASTGPVGVAATAVAATSAVVVAAYPGLAMCAIATVTAWRRARLGLHFLLDGLLVGVAVVGILASTAAALPWLAALGVLRVAVPPWRPWTLRTDPARALAATVALVALVGLLAGAPAAIWPAGATAVAGSFVSKATALRSGRSHSPFGANGELFVPVDVRR
jgi:Fe-S-cluster-containing dehydrogenase component/DMSO reductase anchor subunit